MPHTTVRVGLLCFVAVMSVPTYVSSGGGERPVTLTIYPQHVHFMANTDVSEMISCKSSRSVSICEFKLFDLTDSHRTPILVLEDKPEIKGVKGGECATRLSSSVLTVERFYMVTCRVRTDNTHWVYASMSVFKSNKWTVSLGKTGYDLVVLPGRKQDIAISGSIRLSTCKSKSLQSTLWEWPFYTSAWGNCIASPTFYGGGQGKCGRTCGVTINNATEAHNGIVLLDAWSSNYRDVTFIILIVAKLPNLLALTHELVENDKGSVTLQATCVVTGGHPPPLITWYIGGELVPDEAIRSVPSEVWVWPFEEQTLRQVLTMDLDATHVGKDIECAATHLAYNATIYNAFKIRYGSMVATLMPAPSLPISSTSEMSSHGVTVTTSTSVVTTTPNQEDTTGITTPDIVGVSEELGDDLKCERAGSPAWFYVVIGILASLLILTIIVGVLYARRKPLCCFSRSKDSEKVSVNYRRSLDATLRYEETRSPTISSIDRSSTVTGMEYAEIRVSMVQRCVDKLEANKDAHSAEKSGIYEEASRPNSLYLTYDEQV